MNENMKKALLLFALIISSFPFAKAQETPAPKQFVNETFNAPRMINLQTTETKKKKTLGYRICHRFFEFESGAYGFWGVDGPAGVGLQFDYGITDRFTVGIAHSNWNKLISVWGKYKLLAQTKDNKMPFTLTAYAKAGVTCLKPIDLFGPSPDTTAFDKFTNRLTFVTQLLIARKFGEKFSIQLSPTLIHYNLDYGLYGGPHSNDIFVLGGMASYKISKRFAVNLEYTHAFGNYLQNATLDPIFFDNIAAGIEIKTAGHVFQVFLVNVFPFDEEYAMPFNRVNLFDFKREDRQDVPSQNVPGGFRLGFNIQRDFKL